MTITQNIPIDLESKSSRLSKQASRLSSPNQHIDSSFGVVTMILDEAHNLEGPDLEQVIDALYGSVFESRYTNITDDNLDIVLPALDEQTQELLIKYIANKATEFPYRSEEYLLNITNRTFENLAPANNQLIKEIKEFAGSPERETLLLQANEQDSRFLDILFTVLDSAQKLDQKKYIKVLENIDKQFSYIESPTDQVSSIAKYISTQYRALTNDLFRHSL